MPLLPRRHFCLQIAALVALSLPACSSGEGEYESVPLAKVSGIVHDEGLPVVRATVTFHPVAPVAQPPLNPSATTDEHGTFELTTYEKGDGAPPGEYRVSIEQLVLPDPTATGMQMPVDRYEGRYAQPQSSPWLVKVQEGENLLDAFAIPPEG